MTGSRALVSRVLLGSALAVFAFPVYAFAHWVMVFDKSKPREEVAQQFFAGFPYTWRSGMTIVMIAVAGCAAAIVLARLARPGLTGWWAKTATLLTVAAAVLGAWNLFIIKLP
jgi:hypothetical protein